MDGTRLLALASASGHDLGSVGGPDPLIDQTLAGRYRILRKIGEGGMGIVYEAIHVMIEKHVALKVLREDFSHREDVVERFRQEAKSASRIGHEHIIDISDFGVTPSGAHFFVMELLHGRDLAEELELRGPLPTRRAVAISLQCAKALEAAHAKGIVHRDMKPENIFLVQRDTGDDFVKIVDFGIAKMSDIETGRAIPGRKITSTGMIFGTPEYMSPEQAAGKALDHRVDIYGMGVILYELLTGRVPFCGDTFMGILTQHMFEQAPPIRLVNPGCSAPLEVEQLIGRMLSKDPAERPQSMTLLAAELAQILQFLSLTSSSLPPPGTITHLDQPLPRFARPAASAAANAPRLAPGEFASPHGFASPHVFANDAPARGRSALLGWLALGTVVALLALGLGFSLRAGLFAAPAASLPAASPPAAPQGASPSVLAPATEVRSAGGPVTHEPSAGAPATDAAPVVAVEVRSEPAGATVSVDGHKACPATPCRFDTRRGEAIQVLVQKAGYRTGRAELSPSRDLNQVELTLSRRREGTRGGNRMEGDLMLPDAFGKR